MIAHLWGSIGSGTIFSGNHYGIGQTHCPAWGHGAVNNYGCVPKAGTLRNLKVTNNWGAYTRTFIVCVNGVETAITCVCAAGGQAQDIVHTVDVAPWDQVTVKITHAEANFTDHYADWNLDYDDGGPSFWSLISAKFSGRGQAGTWYFALNTLADTWGYAESEVQYVAPCDGVIKNLRVRTYCTGWAAGWTATLTLRQNGANTAMSISETGGGGGTFNLSSAAEIAVAKGDLLCWRVTNAGSGIDRGKTYYLSCEWVPTAQIGEQAIWTNGSGGNALDAAATKYNSLWSGYTSSWHTQVIREAMFASGYPSSLGQLYVRLSGAPGAGKSYAFTLMRNGAPTTLTCTISDADTVGEDAINLVALSNFDELCIRCVPSGGPAVVSAYYGVVLAGPGEDAVRPRHYAFNRAEV